MIALWLIVIAFLLAHICDQLSAIKKMVKKGTEA